MQIYLVGALIFALIVAIFSINNPNIVPVKFLFWGFRAPLVLIILGSASFGAIVVFLLGVVKQFNLVRKVKTLESKNKRLLEQLEDINKEKEEGKDTQPGEEQSGSDNT